MRLVVSGYYGYGNAGDEAVLAGMLRTIREIQPDVALTILSGDPADTERTHGVPAVARTRPIAVGRALRAADGLISGGGSLLQDATSPRPIAYYAGVMALARALRRPYAMHAQGLGPIRRAPNRWLAAAALRGAAHVSLRDEGSIAFARALGVRRPIELAPDPALALDLGRTDGADGPIVVAVRDWGPDRRHLDGIRDGLRALAAEHRVLAVPMQDPADRDASEAAIAGVPGAEVMAPGATLGERLAAIGSARLVVGMRVHALILAAAAHVPAVALSYDPKVDRFAAQVGHAIVGTAGVAIHAAAFEAAARAAMAADRAPYVERVERLRSGLRAATERTLEAVASAR